jgi:tetratricopeptide (TPR) repeat protein
LRPLLGGYHSARRGFEENEELGTTAAGGRHSKFRTFLSGHDLPLSENLTFRDFLKGALMSSFRLRKLFRGLFALASISIVAGCGTMGGSMANRSGMSYYKKGNYAAAAGEFQNAMKSDPANPDYIANLAKSRMKMGDASNAERYYRQALTIDPSHQPSYHGLAELMLDQGRGQEATAMLSTWAGTQPYVAESHVELAWLQRELGNDSGAVQSLERALDVNPNHATALAHMGQYYEEAGQLEEAVAYYQDSLHADWNQPEVHSRMAAASTGAGAESPMAATAMARGVHPYSIPRQQTAFGPPSAGAQMAQMQMMQTQMAMAGSPMYGSPMYSQTMPGQMAMSQPGPSGNLSAGSMSAHYPSMSSGWQPSNSPMTSMPTQTASFGEQMPMMSQPSETMTWPAGTTMPSDVPFEIPSAPASKTAVTPTPDPAFSEISSETSAAPVTTASYTQTEQVVPAPANSNEAVPLVEAF